MLRGHYAKMTNSHPWRYNFSCRADGTADVHIGVFGGSTWICYPADWICYPNVIFL